jgi:hypothetical protein
MLQGTSGASASDASASDASASDASASDASASDAKRIDVLIALVGAQAERIDVLQSKLEAMHAERDRLRERVRELTAENRRLRTERDDAERAGKRQAAPFRTEAKQRSSSPSRPGRKGGHEASYRPEPAQIDARVDVPIACCLECEAPVCNVRPIRQVIEEIPPITPQVVELTTYRGDCDRCGTVETTHPLKTTSATGAAGTGLGPRAQALALTLREHHGLTMRRVCKILQDGFGLRLTAGGLAQLEQRCAERLEAEEKRLIAAARTAEVQHVDETSWWVAHPEGVGSKETVRSEAQGSKPLQWLWVFADEEQTLYRVDPRRRREVVHEVLGSDFPGVLVSDCLNIYDEATPVQHKCYAHHLKAISRAQADYTAQTGASSDYLAAVRAMLKGAQALKSVQEDLDAETTDAPAMPPSVFEARRSALEATADRLLQRTRADSLTEDSLTEVEDKIRRRLKKQRDHLFTFLEVEAVTATNNRAERRLRPAVIRRKLSSGNRTPQGAQAFERIASVVQTCVQQGRSVIEYLRATRSHGIEPLPLR